MLSIYSKEFRQAVAMASSPNRHERSHRYFGRHEASGLPGYVPDTSINEGLLILGGAGSGKSAALNRLMELQQARGNISIVYGDRKGRDMTAFGALQAGARLAPRPIPFYWFVNQVGLSTHTFDWFAQRHVKQMTPFMKAAAIGMALGTTHGLSGNPQQFYGGASLKAYQAVLTANPNIGSWTELGEAILRNALASKRESDIPPVIREHGTQAWLDCDRMASVEALNVANPSGIDVSTFFERPSTLYLCLPDHEVGGAIFRLFLRSIFDASRYVQKNCGVWIVADEAQVALANSVEMSNTLLQARSVLAPGGLALAMQTLGSLNSTTMDMEAVFRAACSIHWEFSVPVFTDHEVYARGSGQQEVLERTKHYDNTGGMKTLRGETITKVVRERFSQADIKRVSSDPRLSFLTIGKDVEGSFWQYQGNPQIIEGGFHISRDEHRRRSEMPWPPPSEGCIVTKMPTPPSPPPPEPPPKPIERIGRPKKK